LSTTIACLQGAHAILAHFAGPHWLLNDADAKAYASAVNNVARHYDLHAAQKTVDIANLIGMACFVEGTRLLYTRTHAHARGQAQPPEPPPRGQVVPFFQFGANPPGASAAPSTPSPPAEMYGPLPQAPQPDAPPEGQVH